MPLFDRTLGDIILTKHEREPLVNSGGSITPGDTEVCT